MDTLPSEIAAAADALLRGGVVLCATDTVYGLTTMPGRTQSVDEIYRLKGRSRVRPLPVMVADAAQLSQLGVRVSKPARRLLESSLMPGPISLALGFEPGLSRPSWLEGRVEVAIRLPAASVIRTLVVNCGPLLVTSANYTNRPTPPTVSEILSTLDGTPSAVVDTGPCKGVPSTLVNCNLNPPVIERVGIVSAEVVQEIINEP